jgi:hypothetical protein
MELPELRDVFVTRPISYLYRHPNPVASITIHRTDENRNERLVWARCASAQRRSLCEVQRDIEHVASGPIDEVFGDGLRLERQPAAFRHFQWWLLMRWSGRRRAKQIGTFSISNLSGFGALNAHHPLLAATSIAMSPLSKDGESDLVLICDHRVLDGVLAARALDRLEEVLMTDVRTELIAIQRGRDAA